MKKEFNLSEKRSELARGCYFEKDVKEFIKKLKESLRSQHHSDEPDDNLYLAVNKIKGRINKLAGKDLID